MIVPNIYLILLKEIKIINVYINYIGTVELLHKILYETFQKFICYSKIEEKKLYKYINV